MNLEKMVCSLDLAKRLKELGVKQESYFYWTVCHDCTKEYGHEEYSLQEGVGHGENYSAFLSCELDELLPDCNYAQSASGSDRPLLMSKVDGIYCVGIYNPNGSIFPRFADPNPANARAMMLLYLYENKIIEVPK